MKCAFAAEDFDKCFEFAVKYHLDPTKTSSGRTTGRSRSLGEVIDSFLGGKLAELAAVKLLKNTGSKKEYKLNFDIVSTAEVKNEADIIGIRADKKSKYRKPNLFIEIKLASESDHWVGPTLAQFNTIKSQQPDLKKVFFMGLTIKSDSNLDAKTKDLLGIYLKSLSPNSIFKNFDSLNNLNAYLLYIISGEDLQKHGDQFLKGMHFYDTDLFQEVASITQKIILDNKSKRYKVSKIFTDVAPRLLPKSGFISDLQNTIPNSKFFDFESFNGQYKIFEIQNQKSISYYMHCLSNIYAETKYFGSIELEKNKIYKYGISTLGRNPVLARDNIWISTKKLLHLINSDKIQSPKERLKQIAEGI
jgi:hypothetical protein